MSVVLLLLSQFFNKLNREICKYFIYISTRTSLFPWPSRQLPIQANTAARQRSRAEQQQHGTDLGTVILSSFEQRHHWEAQRCASTVPSTSLHKHTVWLSSGERCTQKAWAILQQGKSVLRIICLAQQTVGPHHVTAVKRTSRRKEAWKHWTSMLSLPSPFQRSDTWKHSSIFPPVLNKHMHMHTYIHTDIYICLSSILLWLVQIS